MKFQGLVVIIDKVEKPLGIEDPKTIMDSIYNIGNDTLLKLRNYVTKPNERKQPRTWGSLKAADLIGVSVPTLKKAEADLKSLPSGQSRDKYDRRTYTLEAINFYRDVLGKRYKRPIGSKPMIMSVTNFKGGVTKTSSTVSLAQYAAISGLKTLLIDLDPQGTSTLISSGKIPDLEVSYEETIAGVLLRAPEDIKNVICNTHFNGLDIIPSNLALQDCELGLPNDEVSNKEKLGSPVFRLQKALSYIEDDYDLILMDCGPNLGILTLNAITASNSMIIPIPPSMYDYASFIMLTGTLKELFQSLEGKRFDYFRILIAKHNGSQEAQKMEATMRTQFGDYILSHDMCETVEIAKAASEISTLYDTSKPRGNRETYRRAIQHANAVNNEIITDFKQIWEQMGNGEHP